MTIATERQQTHHAAEVENKVETTPEVAPETPSIVMRWA